MTRVSGAPDDVDVNDYFPSVTDNSGGSGGDRGRTGGGQGTGSSGTATENVGSTSTLTFGTPADQAYAYYARQWMQDYIDNTPQRVAMGLVMGSIFGTLGGEIGATEGILTEVRLVRNPWGKLGGPEHQEVVNVLENEFLQQGYKVQREVYSATPEGIKRGRFADLTVTNPNGNQFVIQVGKQTQSSAPISREMKALQDFRNLGIKAFFIPYK